MKEGFSEAEVRYLLAWAVEDHRGLANGPARALQRAHGVHAAVMGQLIARLSTVMGRAQCEIVQVPVSEAPVRWPWPTSQAFESRMKELLPETTVDYLDKLGVLPGAAVTSK
jgi:hypothetical protein